MDSKEQYEVDHLADGTEKIIDLSKIKNPVYSNVTLPAGGFALASGQGLTYTAVTGVNPTWSANGTTGTMHAKDLVLDGVSLKQLLEDRLNLLVPNPELEKEWDQLKELGDQYRRLEADLKEKARIWQALNKKS